MASEKYKQVRAVLGDEFDDVLRTKLLTALNHLGAVQIGVTDRAVVGSQDMERLAVDIAGRTLNVEAETYIGLSISGPEDLVQEVRSLVSAR